MARRAGPRPEGPGEVLAREIVARCLGAVVERYDDGTRDAMPDGLIRHPDGTTAGLEVVGDQAAGVPRAADRAREAGAPPPDRQGAPLALGGLDRGRRAHRAGARGPARPASSGGGTAPDRPTRASRALRDGSVDEPPASEDGPNGWERLHVFTANAYADGQPGEVNLISAPFSGFGLGPDAVTDWVEDVLSREADVGAKLDAADLGPEGHAFVWVTISSAIAVQAALDIGAGQRLPTRDPVLPPASPTSGWSARTPLPAPRDGSLGRAGASWVSAGPATDRSSSRNLPRCPGNGAARR